MLKDPLLKLFSWPIYLQKQIPGHSILGLQTPWCQVSASPGRDWSLNVKFAVCLMSLVYTLGCYESTVYTV